MDKSKSKSNRRKHQRFAATAFLNTPVILKPLPPFFGGEIKGKLIDLSAGGMAILIKEFIPALTKLSLSLKFPDSSVLEATTVVRRVISRDNRMLHGIEFESLDPVMVEKIEMMSAAYIDCEMRIQKKDLQVCYHECAFYNMCSKPQKNEPVLDPTLINLELAFKQLDQFHLVPTQGLLL